MMVNVGCAAPCEHFHASNRHARGDRMGFCLNLRISPASAPAVTALWDQVGALERRPSRRPLGYPPHLTFAIYDTDDVSDASRIRASDRAAAGQSELRLHFERLGVFEGPSLVIWADPGPQDGLR